jgi:hypothetical protein
MKTDSKHKDQKQQRALPDTLEPIMVIAADVPKTKTAEMLVQYGYVLLVALNADGSEKQGSEFLYPERNYKKFYGNETKYRVKQFSNINKSTSIYETIVRASQSITLRAHAGCRSCGK